MPKIGGINGGHVLNEQEVRHIVITQESLLTSSDLEISNRFIFLIRMQIYFAIA